MIPSIEGQCHKDLNLAEEWIFHGKRDGPNFFLKLRTEKFTRVVRTSSQFFRTSGSNEEKIERKKIQQNRFFFLGARIMAILHVGKRCLSRQNFGAHFSSLCPRVSFMQGEKYSSCSFGCLSSHKLYITTASSIFNIENNEIPI